MSVTIPNTAGDIHIGELTEATLEGTGVFDTLMRSVKAHLQEEYNANRMRGTDYANAYIQLMTQVLDQANRYALAKAKLPLELQLLEAEITKVATDTAVATKQGALLEAQTSKELAQINMINQEVKHKLPAEVAQIQKQTALAEYELKYIKPRQLELANKDILLKQNQIDLQTKELALKDKQIGLAEYELTKIKPKELELMAADIGLKKNQIQLGLKEIAIKEKQLPLMDKELDLKAKQIDIAQAEIGLKQQQIENVRYELQYKLPAEVALANSQSGLYTQKTTTERAQTNGSVIGNGSVIYKQNHLLDEQAKTYLRDAMEKTFSMLTDTWKVRKNADEIVNANTKNKLMDENIGTMLQALGSEIGVNFT